MSDSIALAIKPIVRYPRVAQVGKTYLMTIDLEVEPGAEWNYDEEEYPVYCEVDSELFKTQIVGEPVIVLHRFGGSYGEAKFLVTAAAEARQGNVKVGLINAWGVPFKTINLEGVQLLLREVAHTIADIESITTVANPSPTASEKPIVKSLEVQEDSETPEITVGLALVVTSLPVEYLAVRSYLQDLQEEVSAQGTIYARGRFIANSRNWEVGIVEIRAGNVGAALEAERASAHFKPDVILFVGVASGLKDVAIGDVVVSTKIYSYESGKANPRYYPRPNIELSAYNLEQRARAEAKKGDWLERLAEVPEIRPSIFVGPIAAGEKVVAFTQSEVFQFLSENYVDAIAVDMGGLGFLEAVRTTRTDAIIIRGISDRLEETSDTTDGITIDQSSRQGLAAFYASAFAFEVLASLSLIPNNVPPSGAFNFIGREDALEWLHTQLQQENPTLISIAGMGGVGKTELVLQYTKQYSSSYEGGICWVFGREFNVGTQILGFAQSKLNIKIPEWLDLNDQVAFCWRHWNAGEVLLVLDDVVSYQDVLPYLPSEERSRFKIVMTTRKKFRSPVQSLSLDVLSLQESLELLTVLIGEQRVKQELDIAQYLCAWLEGLPLAIELVGNYLIKRTDLSLATLLFRLQEKAKSREAIKHLSLHWDEKMATSTARRGVEETFGLSWLELDNNGHHLAKLLSLFAPVSIPWNLVEAVEREYCKSSKGVKVFNAEEFEDVRDSQLMCFNLLQRIELGVYRLHSLVREFFRSKLEFEEESLIESPKNNTNIVVEESKNIQELINRMSVSDLFTESIMFKI